jgi:hypothetical protein
MTAGPASAAAIVEIWERGLYQHPVDRALTVLCVLTGRSHRELAELPVEQRDSQLLEWRGRIFGGPLSGYATCPRCGCDVDVSVSVAGLGATVEHEERFPVETGGKTLRVRMPTSLDLAAAAQCDTVQTARRELARRCAQGEDDGDLDDDGLADEDVAAIEAELGRRAGTSGALIELVCPDCGHGWELGLDVAAFLWREIEIVATRLLRNVDVLARRYGWTERDIFALSPARRNFYLELDA